MKKIYTLNRTHKLYSNLITIIPISIILLITIYASQIQAQNSYSLQFSDTSTWDNTCGNVKPSQWSVKSDSCVLYTPFFRKETAGCMDILYEFKINQSGNGDVDDHVYVQYQLNNGPWITDTMLIASNYAAVHTLYGSVNICYGTVIRIRLILVTNSNSEFWSIKNGDGTLEGSFVTYPTYPPIILPIELSSYKIVCTGIGTRISWSTASEIKNEFFTIEKSYDLINWNILSIVPGAINSNIERFYSVEDKSVNQYSTYYRLKQTDLDGTSKTFDILTTKCSQIYKDFSSDIYVKENQLILSINSVDPNIVRIEVYDITGKILLNQNYIPEQGNNDMSIDISNINAGIILISVIQNTNKVSKKIMIQ